MSLINSHRLRVCAHCGAAFEIPSPSSKRKFCSRECSGESLVRPLEKRFWERVNEDGPLPEKRPDLGPCWVWTAYCNPGGYGMIRSRAIAHYAHRLSYEMHVGPIPDGFDIDHLCRNRACVNPQHLEAVTRRENLLRGEHPDAINRRLGRCKWGHERTNENTRIGPDGSAKCRVCDRERAAKKRQARKERERDGLDRGL